jgi:hypothetical protein
VSIPEKTRQAYRRGRTLTREEQLALALDGVLPVRDARAEDACRAAIWSDRESVEPVLARLRALGRSAVVTLSGPFDPLHRLLAILAVPHCVANSPEDVPGGARVVAVGCCSDADSINHVVASLRDRDVILLTSDKTALFPALAEQLQPLPPRPGRLARIMFEPGVVSENDRGGGIFPGISLAAGYVPIEASAVSADTRVLARDADTAEPLMMVLSVGRATVLHSVAHWWQCDPLGQTAVDMRLLSDIPTLASLGHEFPTVRFGEFQAARAMIAGLAAGLAVCLATQ